MATFTQQISDANQDGQSYSAAWQASGLSSGFSSGSIICPGVRFTSVTIPQAAAITLATLSVVQRIKPGTPTNAIVGKWFGDKVANAAAWGSSSRPDQITPTTASTQIQFGTNETTYTHNITAIVQELVNQGSWASGNAMRFAGMTQTGSGTNQVVFYDVSDASSSGKTAMLSVTYTAGTAYNVTISVTAMSAATCGHTTGKTLAYAARGFSSFAKVPGKTLSAMAIANASLRRGLSRTIAVTALSSATVSKGWARTVSVVAQGFAGLLKTRAKIVAATGFSAVSIGVGKALSQTISVVALSAVSVSASRVFHQVISVTGLALTTLDTLYFKAPAVPRRIVVAGVIFAIAS